MYCKNCGNELKEGAEVCMKCGKYTNQQSTNPPMSNGAGKVLSFFIPIIGFIFFGLYKDKHPEFSKGCLTLAIVGISINVVFLILNFILQILVATV